MKLFILLAATAAFSWDQLHASPFYPKFEKDTSIVNHSLDGSTAEWPDSLFQTDKETNIRYAADNDAQDLFLALVLPDFRTQMKMMRQGMNLYIDLKGKKKEGRGIAFPMKRENDEGFNGSGSGNQENNNQSRNFDKKAMRASLVMYLIKMKLFGFSGDEPAEQGLEVEGSANVAFSWDSTDAMHIEYLIPLKMLGDVASLNQKTISIGWKINGVDMPTSSNNQNFSNTSTSPQTGRRGGGGGNFRGQNRNNNNFSEADRDKMMSEQSFWTKYTFKL